jgi:hypothetical protein
MSRTYGIEYPWHDGKYILPIEAESADDAMARVKQAGNLGRCFTPHGMEKIAINARWYANAVIWLRNAFRRG